MMNDCEMMARDRLLKSFKTLWQTGRANSYCKPLHHRNVPVRNKAVTEMIVCTTCETLAVQVEDLGM